MKRILSTFSLMGCLSFLNPLHAQVTFEKTFKRTKLHTLDEGKAVQQTADGGYIAAGGTALDDGTTAVYLVKTNSSGGILWTKTYNLGNYSEAAAVYELSSGGYIIAGNKVATNSYDMFLLQTDATGTVLWSKNYGGSGDEMLQGLIKTTDGGYLMTGSTSSFGGGGKDVYLVKTKANGDTLFTRTYGTAGNDIGYCATQTSTGFVVAGATAVNTSTIYIYLIKTTNTGDSIWTRSYGTPDYETSGTAIVQTTDGYVISGGRNNYSSGSLTGTIHLFKTNLDGTPVFAKSLNYGMAGNGISYTNLFLNAAGEYVIGASTFCTCASGASEYLFMKLDNTSNMVWFTSYSTGAMFQPTSDMGYVIAGRRMNNTDPDLYLVKTNTLGKTTCNTQRPLGQTTSWVPTRSIMRSQVTSGKSLVASITQTSGTGGFDSSICSIVTAISNIEKQIKPSVVAPNPFNTSATLTISADVHAQNAVLEIYDAIGRMVQTIPVSETNTIKLERGNMETGIYSFTIKDDAGVAERGRFIIR